MVESFEEDPDVASAVIVPGSGPDAYQITLDEGVAAEKLGSVTARLGDIATDAADDRWTYSVRAGAWQWRLSGDEEASVKRAAAIAALAELEGVYSATIGTSDEGLVVEIVTVPAADVTSFPAAVSAIADAGEVPDIALLHVSDLQERRVVDTRDLSRVRTKVTAVQAAESAGEIQSFEITDEKVNLRMRTDVDAAAAAAAIEAALPGESISRLSLTSGLVTAGAGTDPAAAASIANVLAPISGIIEAEVVVRGHNRALLVVTTSDIETALLAQQTLTADPTLLQPYRALQFTVPHADEPGAVLRAVSMRETGYVGSLEPAAELAASEGVQGSVVYTSSDLELVMTPDADPSIVAAAVKALPLRPQQEVEVFGSTAWGPISEDAAYLFDVAGKLHPHTVNGYGDVDTFIEGWNNAPAP